MSILYHPSNENIVADAMSRKTMGSVAHVPDDKKVLVKEVHKLARLGVRLEDCTNRGSIVHHNSKLSLEVKVKSKQNLNPLLMELKESVHRNLTGHSSEGGWGTRIPR